MRPIQLKEHVQFETGPFLIGSILVGVGALLAFLGLAIGGLHSVNQGIGWAEAGNKAPGIWLKRSGPK